MILRRLIEIKGNSGNRLDNFSIIGGTYAQASS